MEQMCTSVCFHVYGCFSRLSEHFLSLRAIAAMGKKASLREVLAKGKALNQAMKDHPPPAEVAEEYHVPLTATLPGGLTLQGFMKKNALTYSEACKVYHAYTSYAEQELDNAACKDKDKKRSKTAKVVEEEEDKPKKGKKASAASKRKHEKNEEEEEEEEQPEETVKSKRSKSSSSAKPGTKKKSKANSEEQVVEEEAEEGKPEAEPAKPDVRRKLTFAAAFSSDDEFVPEAEDAVSPKMLRRVSRKRALTNSEQKAYNMRGELCEAKGPDVGGPAPKKVTWSEPLARPATKIHRQNASDEFESPSETKPGLDRKWSLGFNTFPKPLSLTIWSPNTISPTQVVWYFEGR